MKKLFGRKIGMTQLFDTNGKAITCTIIQAQPNLVLENKPNNSIKIGYGETKENKLNKPEVGVFKKIGVNVRKNIRTLSNVEGNYKPGDEFGVEIFKPGEYVDVQGITKGHGYTGAIKR
jgi:large subunit ribosomal protein L3